MVPFILRGCLQMIIMISSADGIAWTWRIHKIQTTTTCAFVESLHFKQAVNKSSIWAIWLFQRMATVVGKRHLINIAATPYFTTIYKSTRSITTQSKTHNSAQFQAIQLTRNQAHVPAPLAYAAESWASCTTASPYAATPTLLSDAVDTPSKALCI